MTQAKLNTELYQKMFAEQEKYKEWLRTLTPDEVMDHAYEYTCREDILLSLGYNDLSPRQAMALLKSSSPLADVFKKWEKQETSHMDDIWNTVTARANDVVRADFVTQRRDDAR